MASRRRAFSILEVLLASLLVGLGLLALIGVQIYSLKAGRGTTGRYTASVLAASLISECEARLTEGFDDPIDQGRTAAPSYPGYDFTVTSAVEGPNLKKVQVTVLWRDEQQVDRQYVLWTKVVR